jgi:hypothetical protein
VERRLKGSVFLGGEKSEKKKSWNFNDFSEKLFFFSHELVFDV